MRSHSFLFLALCSGLLVEIITATSQPLLPPLSCLAPTNIDHGHYHYETHEGENESGAVIKYVCDQPFWKLPQEDHGIYVCSCSHHWENTVLGYTLPTCVKDTDCGPPPTINHGTHKYITPDGENSLLAAVQYSCDHYAWDLVHVGDDVYVCTPKGKWQNMNQQEKLPVCHQRHCNEPEKIAHGHMEHKTEHNDNSYLSVIKYTCDHGYMENSVTDDGHYSCDADAHWYNTQVGNHLTACKEVKAGEPLVVLDPAHPPVSSLVPKGASPWSALIVLPDHSIHNGFLVFDHTVLTSLEIFGEQQITNEMIQGMKVYLGVRCRHDMEKAHAYKVSNIISEAKNKFAIVRLVEKVHYGNYIVPIAVPHEDLVSTADFGIAAGWDVGHHDKPEDHVYLTVQSVENKEACMTCLTENYPQNGPDFTGLFCTKARDSSIRLDDHDDGLALEIRVNGTSYAAGLLSSSKACEGDLEVFLDLFAFEPLYQQLQKLH